MNNTNESWEFQAPRLPYLHVGNTTQRHKIRNAQCLEQGAKFGNGRYDAQLSDEAQVRQAATQSQKDTDEYMYVPSHIRECININMIIIT